MTLGFCSMLLLCLAVVKSTRSDLQRLASVAAPRGTMERVLLPVPDTRQGTPFSCGASALQAILMYWGMELRESKLMKILHTSPETGTTPEDIVRVAVNLGFRADLRQNLGIRDLEASMREGVPVIVMIQAWREGEDLRKPWTDVWESGHYVVVIGADDEKMYFEDPSILGSKGYLPRKEFLERWHDTNGKKYIRAGIFIRGKKPSPPPSYLPID